MQKFTKIGRFKRENDHLVIKIWKWKSPFEILDMKNLSA